MVFKSPIFPAMPSEVYQEWAKEQLAQAINNLGCAKDALDAFGAGERAVELRNIMLKLGTILESV